MSGARSGPQSGRGGISPRDVVGIDFGTTNSIACYMGADGLVQAVMFDGGERIIKSIVAYEACGTINVGKVALSRMKTLPDVVKSCKRVLGRSLDDVNVQFNASVCHATLVRDAEGFAAFSIHGSVKRAEEVAKDIFSHIRRTIDARNGSPILNAVITVPANASTYQKQQTERAAKEAGYNVLAMISEPDAAGYAYGYGQAEKNEGTILVYDFGGGTFDATILRCHASGFAMVMSEGDVSLGGDDIDMEIANWVQAEYLRSTGEELIQVPAHLKDAAAREQRKRRMLSELCSMCRIAKEALATSEGTHISISALNDDAEDIRLSRAKLKELAKESINKTMKCVRKLLSDARMEAKDIDKVILVGGSSQLHGVVEAVESLFKKDKIEHGISREECVAQGAQLFGGRGETAPPMISRAIQHIGVEVATENGASELYPIIYRGCELPTRSPEEVFKTTETGQKKLDVRVYQGNDIHDLSRNANLGVLSVPLKTIAAKGAVGIVIVMEMDTYSRVYCRVWEEYNGQRQELIRRQEFKGQIR